MKKKSIIKVSSIIILLLIIYYGCSSKEKPKNDNMIFVTTSIAKVDNIPVYIEALGTVTPQYSININAQANGQLTKLYFKDGQEVKQGDLLAQIDNRPYVAALNQHQSQLDKDTNLLENAKIDLNRYQSLNKDSFISKQTTDNQSSLVKQFEAAVKGDQALVDNAKINLSYCDIKSPIDGRVGLHLIDEGNILNASSAAIVVVNSIDPMMVKFSITEEQLTAVLSKFNKDDIVVQAFDSLANKLLATGKLIAIDNQINSATGTIALKASFDNKDKLLFPNQFVNVKLLLDNLSNVVVIPESAIEYDQNSTYVYRLQDQNKAQKVKVVVANVKDGNVVITSGIVENDEVITQGADKVVDGTLVKLHN